MSSYVACKFCTLKMSRIWVQDSKAVNQVTLSSIISSEFLKSSPLVVIAEWPFTLILNRLPFGYISFWLFPPFSSGYHLQTTRDMRPHPSVSLDPATNFNPPQFRSRNQSYMRAVSTFSQASCVSQVSPTTRNTTRHWHTGTSKDNLHIVSGFKQRALAVWDVLLFSQIVSWAALNGFPLKASLRCWLIISWSKLVQGGLGGGWILLEGSFTTC